MARFAGALIALVLAAATAASAALPPRAIDRFGWTVTPTTGPRRIVSVAPSVTEILFALGLDDRIVGISDADDYPPDRLLGRARVGGVQLNVEAILGLHPDLIVGVWELQRTQLDYLIAARLPVVAVQARTLPDVYAQIEMLGHLTGRDDAARRVVAAMRAKEQTIAAEARRRRPVRIYVEIWGEPPIGAGEGTIVDDLIRRAGGTNVLAGLAGWPEVNEEIVVARDPELIALAYPGRAQMLDRRAWTHVAAVRTGRVVQVPSALLSRPGPRVVLGLEILARAAQGQAWSP